MNRLVRRAIHKKENQAISINSGGINMQQTTLQVSGMMCNHCVKSVEEALTALGVSGRVDLHQGTVFVEYDENKVRLAAIKDAIEYIGYDVN
nr:cation transporter [Paenibacillus allorhizosphaerae]